MTLLPFFNNNIPGVIPYTSTLKQFHSYRLVGRKRTNLADTGNDKLCLSIPEPFPFLLNTCKEIICLN